MAASAEANRRLAHLCGDHYLSADTKSAHPLNDSPVPVMKSSKYSGLLLAAVIGTALAARFAFLISHQAIFDDAYITFRYAGNILDGQGFVYNPGEPVYGASSPLYTILSAAILFLSSQRTFSP